MALQSAGLSQNPHSFEGRRERAYDQSLEDVRSGQITVEQYHALPGREKHPKHRTPEETRLSQSNAYHAGSTVDPEWSPFVGHPTIGQGRAGRSPVWRSGTGRESRSSGSAYGTGEHPNATWMDKHNFAPANSLGSRARRENQLWTNRQQQQRRAAQHLDRHGSVAGIPRQEAPPTTIGAGSARHQNPTGPSPQGPQAPPTNAPYYGRNHQPMSDLEIKNRRAQARLRQNGWQGGGNTNVRQRSKFQQYRPQTSQSSSYSGPSTGGTVGMAGGGTVPQGSGSALDPFWENQIQHSMWKGPSKHSYYRPNSSLSGNFQPNIYGSGQYFAGGGAKPPGPISLPSTSPVSPTPGVGGRKQGRAVASAGGGTVPQGGRYTGTNARSIPQFNLLQGGPSSPYHPAPMRASGMPTHKRGSVWQGQPPRMAGGGEVPGDQYYSGGGAALGTDTVPAMLTPGEFVVSRPAVQKIGLNNLLEMNAAGGGTNRPTVGPGGLYARGGGRVRFGFGSHKRRPSRPSPMSTASWVKPAGTKPFAGSNNSFLSDLSADYQTQMDEANAANEHRYQQILAGYDKLREDTLGNLDAANEAASTGYQGVVSGYGDLSNQVQAGYGNLQNLISNSYNANSAANEAQYQNILGGYSGLQDRTLTGLDAANAARDAEYANILDSYGGLKDRTLEGMKASDTANEAQYQNILGGYGDLRGRTLEGMDTSSAAAEARYADMAGRYGDLRERTLAGMETLGQDQLAESRKAYDQSLAATTAQQAARGLGGTTVGASIKQGTDRGYQDAVRGIQESVLARKSAADMGLTRGQLSMEERFQGARDAAAARRTAADMGLTQAELGQATRFQSAREASQARQVAADMGLSQAQIGAQTQFANAKEAAAARRAAMDVGLTQAQMGQAAQFQGARESAQMQQIAAQMGISQSQLASMTGLGQAGLAAQSQLVNQMQSSADRRAAIDQGLTQAKLGAIERREDIAPNFNNLVTIAQGMAAGGYGEGYDGASDIKKLLAKLPSGMGKVDVPKHWGTFPRPKPEAGKARDKWESDYAKWIAQNIEADASGGRDAWEHASPFTEGMNRETIAGQYTEGEPPKKLNPYEQLASGLLGR